VAAFALSHIIKQTTMKLLPGLLMLVAGILFMAGTTFIARSTTAPSHVLSVHHSVQSDSS